MKFDAQWYVAPAPQLRAQGMALVGAMPIRKRPAWLRDLLLTLQPLLPLPFQDLAASLGAIAKKETAWPEARAVFNVLRTHSLQSAPNVWVTILEVIAKEIYNSSQPSALFDRDVAGGLLSLLAALYCQIDGKIGEQWRDIECALFRRPTFVAWPVP